MLSTIQPVARRLKVNRLSIARLVIIIVGFSSLEAPGQVATDRAITAGRSIVEVIDAFRAEGLPFAYSSTLLPNDLTVVRAPTARAPLEIVREILQPYELTILLVEGLYVVSRIPQEADVTDVDRPSFTRRPTEVPLPELVVIASRYEFLREALGSPAFISQRAIQKLPNFGEDPLRAVQRLPGAAAGGVSAMAHIRGAESGDTGLILNGQRLLDPFHIRDFQSVFSAVDARTVEGVEVYTGGFPAQYGDRIGGLMLIDTIEPAADRHSEVGLSVFNTSLMTAGTLANGKAEWLVSARRGNLDLVLKESLGEPLYYDIFTQVAANFSPRSKVSVNALYGRDQVRIIAENDVTELEQSSNESHNGQFWVHWSQDWTDLLSSSTAISISQFESNRLGLIDDPEKIVGAVSDFRDINIFGARQDWKLEYGEDHQFSWGVDYKHLKGFYDYAGTVEYFGLFLDFDNVAPTLTRSSTLSVEGDSFAIYLSDRWRLGAKTVAELGVRWDKQTYTGLAGQTQFSPRFSLVQAVGPKTDLRLSWGRYYQSQGINELQVEDGIEQFFPAQRSDTAVVGLQHRFRDDYAFRLEAYWKFLNSQRPRFENLFDPLAIIPELEPDRVLVVADKARSRGIEASVAYDTAGAFSWWASYTLAEINDRIDGQDVPRSWDQMHAVQVGLDWELERWDFGIATNVHSGWPRTDISILPSNVPNSPMVVFGPRNAGRFGSFASLDLKVSYKAPVRHGALSFFMELSNVTDRNNPCCLDIDLNVDASGNTFVEQKEDYWLPFLPAIGVLWEF